MKKRLLWLTLISIHAIAHGQISLVVYEGKVVFPDGRTLVLNHKYTVPEQGNINISLHATVLVFNKNHYFKIDTDSDPKKMSLNDASPEFNYRQFKIKLEGTAKSSAGLQGYLDRLHELSRTQESTAGATPGAVKAITDRNPRQSGREDVTWPPDSVKLLSSTVRLQWSRASQAYGANLVLINLQSNDTVYNQPAPAGLNATVTIAEAGTYTWTLYSKMQKDKKISRVIIKPDAKELVKLTGAVTLFKEQLSGFDEETAALILDDYLYQNNIVEN